MEDNAVKDLQVAISKLVLCAQWSQEEAAKPCFGVCVVRGARNIEDILEHNPLGK
jgi:hypothetical protein